MSRTSAASGPLTGVRVVEFAGIGPGPFAAMMLSDMGADVVSVVRRGAGKRDDRDFVNRGRRIVELDLKAPGDVAHALDLIAQADVLLEGFRPQVMERLGLGPDETLKRNPRLVYGRMTGWGQEGPLAQAAGHDINYIAITGALDSFRASNGEAVSPLNLVGDYGGGALFLVVGVLAAVIEARASGKGQVVDVAMCDGVSLMLSMFHSMHALKRWTEQPRTNMLDGGAHFYRPYECADGRFISIGAIEPQFYAELRKLAGLTDPAFDAQMDRSRWPELQDKLAAVFKTKTCDEWCALLEGTDACAAAVVGLFEASSHPHLAARRTFVEHAGNLQPAPAPRFSRTRSAIQGPAAVPPTSIPDILAAWSDRRQAAS
ncbi:CaiB/BaiF CoA transferase family protein [Bradyrhizobium sp. 2TAF24]|uniref:CaiB/BaiF CoA transferase family protein n=1 Tax=Bradyrhizobium sp. 2TAF24 TaxID=3233011 RepID=UPI003F903B34